MIQPNTIVEMAEKQGWKIRDHQPNISLLILQRGEEQMNIYYSKMTVGTVVPHPKGKKQMFRKNVDMPMLTKLLRKPREHTGIGYARKKRMSTMTLVSKKSFHHDDQHKFWERKYFNHPSVELVEQIWKLKPHWLNSKDERIKLKIRAVRTALDYISQHKEDQD